MLEAHPGSPVDLTHRRTSTVTSLETIRASEQDRIRERSTSARSAGSASFNEEDIGWGGAAAKVPSTVGNDGDDLSHGTSTRASSPRGSVYTPLKTPSQLEVRAIPSLSSLNNDKLYDMSIDTAIEICPDLDGDEDLQTWMSKLSPQNIVSRDSISTANTTLYDDRSVNGNGLTIDTSNISRYRTGSSSVSASGESIYSTSTMAADVYGWEEELERQVLEKQSSTADGRRVSVGSGVGLGFGPIQFFEPNWRSPSAERPLARQFRPPVQRRRADKSKDRVDSGRRKSLLYRVLSLSGSYGPARDTNSPATSSAPQPLVSGVVGNEMRDHMYLYPPPNSCFERR